MSLNSQGLVEFKSQFSARVGIHLNNAGMAPIPKIAADRASRLVVECQQDGGNAFPKWMIEITSARLKLAKFLGAIDSDQIAFTQNCATALSHVAFGFPLTPKDTVITIDQEYASNFYPWQEACKRSGAKLEVIQSERDLTLSHEKILSSIKPGVKLVCVSWVQFQSGTILDLRAIGNRCHEVGAFFIVDAVQGLGQLPFSFSDLPVDFVASGVYKWMCSLQGAAFLAVKPELCKLLSPAVVGCGTFNRYNSTAEPGSPMESTARKFEAGSPPLPQLVVLNEVLSLFEKLKIQDLSNEISRLSSILRVGIKECGAKLLTPFEQAGGITGFQLPQDQEIKLLARCEAAKIYIVKRGTSIRVSPHAFNSDEDISVFLKVLKEVL